MRKVFVLLTVFAFVFSSAFAEDYIKRTTLNGDGKVKISSTDTTSDYVNTKLVAGSNITLTKSNNNANETLTIASTGGGGASGLNELTGYSTTKILQVGGLGTTGVISGNTISGNTINISGQATLPQNAPVTGQTIVFQAGGSSLWQTPSAGGGTPGGNNTEVQFNDSTTFGGDTNFIWDKNANRLTVTGNAVISRLTGSKDFPVQSARLLPVNTAVGPLISVQEATWSLDFSADYSNTILYQFRLPPTYSANPILYLNYTTTGSSGTFQIFTAIHAVTSGDSVVFHYNNFDTTNNSTKYTVPATAGYLGEVVIPLISNDNMTSGDTVLIKINRDATVVNDTLASALSLKSIQLTWE